MRYILALLLTATTVHAQYNWRTRDDDPNRIYLYNDDRQIGGWDYNLGIWRDYNGEWGPEKKVPFQSPPERVQAPAVNFGVDLKGEIIQDDLPIPDYANKFRLTCTSDQRQKVQADWQTVEPDLANRVVFWSVPKDHWAVKDFAEGMTFQSPDGKVLHRQTDYNGPQDFTALRKAIATYDATKDPDLRKDDNKSAPWLALAGMVGAYFYTKRNTNAPA